MHTWERPTIEQRGDLGRFDTVVLCLGSVNRLHVEGVPQDEGYPCVTAQIGQPVPGEHAFDTDDHVAREGFDSLEKDGRIGSKIAMKDCVALPVEDTDVDRPGVQVDAA